MAEQTLPGGLVPDTTRAIAHSCLVPGRRAKHHAARSTHLGRRNDLRTAHLFVHSGPAAGSAQAIRNQTLPIWKKHGLRPVGFWTVLVGDGNHDLHYMLAWELLAEREKIWNTFQADPAWISARADSEKDGPILANIKSSFLVPTAFSAIVTRPPWRAASITSSTRCTISTLPPRSTARSAFRSARATARAVLGHAEPHRPARRQLHRIAHGRGPAGSPRMAAVFLVRRVQSRCARARRGALDAGARKAARASRRKEFRGAGIGDFDVFDFEREGRRPDGTPIKVAFSLAFAATRPRRTSASSPASTDFRRISGIRHFRCISIPPQASPAWSWWRQCRRTTIVPDLVHRRPRSGGLDERARRHDAAAAKSR